MSYGLLAGLALALFGALLVAIARRAELRRMRTALREREQAVERGSARAQLQHPRIDLSRCLGCATCVAVCPEDGVLAVVHGQAAVVNGARCQGIAACERECPVGAITMTLGDLGERRDVPVLGEGLEAVGSPGLFLAGEVTAQALIRTAVEQGTLVARQVAERRRATSGTPAPDAPLDLCIVGAGPAGLACALEATRHRLRFIVLEQEDDLGGTVARYPRRKLVLTQPVDLPLVGRLRRTSYTKEELIEVWQRAAAEHELSIAFGVVVTGVERDGDDRFVIRSSRGEWRAQHVCFALGRRGVPRRLGVPGEELPKVAYTLLDAASYVGRRALVVGGGDSAVETALALAEQDGNQVVLSYRKDAFFRIRSKNEERLTRALDDGRIRTLLRSDVTEITPQSAMLDVVDEAGEHRRLQLANDEVFVMAGGDPPFELLERSGVSFDPALRPAVDGVEEQGSGLLRALAIGLCLTLAALGWALAHADYYGLPLAERPTHADHATLRPGLGLGLAFGIASIALILLNLSYLLRRSPRGWIRFGSLRAWMTSHIATGLLAFLCALLHAAMAPRDTPGGNAFWALAVLVLTGAIGRYLYAWLPRAANGRELALTELRGRLAALGDGSGARAGFGAEVKAAIDGLIDARQWQGNFAGRLLAVFGLELRLRRTLRRLAADGRARGIDGVELGTALALGREAHRCALAVAHLEDLRALLSTWRWLHRWVAVLLIALVAVHVFYALAYGSFLIEQGGG